MIRTPSLLLAAALCAAAASGVEFTGHVVIAQRAPVDCAPLGGFTLVKCREGLWLVDWSRPEAARDSLLVRRDLPTDGHRAPLVAWGDSVVALAPEGEGGHLVVHLDGAGRPVVDEVAAADWLPDMAWLGGRPWFADATEHRLRLLPALAAGGDTVTVEPGTSSPVQSVAFARDRVVFGRLVEESDGSVFQAWDLTDPDAPVAGAPVRVEGYLRDMIIVDGVLYTGAFALQSWDLASVAQPAPLGRLSHGILRGFVRGPGDRLAAWSDGRMLWIIDVGDPTAPRFTATFTMTGASRPPERLAFGEEHLVVQQDPRVRGFSLPAWSGASMRDVGDAWPVLGYAPVATDGRFTWIQHSERMLADPEAGLIVSCPDADVARDGADCAFLAWHRGHLLSVPGDGRLVSEDAGDPLHPRTVWEDVPDGGAADAMLHGDQLAVATGRSFVVYDVTEPASPRRRGSVARGAAARTRAAVTDSLLVVVQAVGEYSYLDGYDHVLSVHDIGTDDSFTLAAQVPFAWSDTYDLMRIAVEDVRVADGEVFAYAFYSTGLDWDVVAVRLDLTDPSAPRWGDPVYPRAFFAPRGQALMATPSGSYLISCRYGELQAQRHDGPEPTFGPVVASARIDRPVSYYGTTLAIAPDDGHVSVVTAAGVETLFLSGVGFDPPPPPPPSAPAGAVLAVPNPFNPATRLCFDVAVAGPVRVDVFDLAGRRVRTLRAELPAGPAALPWDGLDDDGRTLASGVYLVRAEAGDVPQRGRCVLVR